MVKKFMEKKPSSSSSKAVMMVIPLDVIAEDLKKTARKGTSFKGLHKKLFGTGNETTVFDSKKKKEVKALIEVKENTRTLAMVLRSERELLGMNKEQEMEISQLKFMLEEKSTEMGLRASKNKNDSGFHTNWDQNFVSIGIDDLQDDEADRTHTNSTGNTSIVRGMAHSYSSLEEVSAALSKEGLKASRLLIGIDFTKSNERTGKVSFNNWSLHAIGYTSNPYEKTISIIGKTLSPFNEDNLIPCFGFGDEITHDREVFSFHSDHSPCHGPEAALSCYRKIARNAKLAGPTSYAPVIEAAIDIVEKSGGQYHVLLIIANGLVTRSSDLSDKELSPQEEQTLKSIVNARSYPLSIVVVRVGDGPWEDMKKFGDELRARECHNFKTVNFTEIMSTNVTSAEKEIAFARAALMEIPFQYKAAVELGILGHVTGRAEQIVPRPPPVPPTCGTSSSLVCPICLTNAKELAFGCGHTTCRDCGPELTNCPVCRESITYSQRVYF